MGKRQTATPCSENLGMEHLFHGCWEGMGEGEGERERDRGTERKGKISLFKDSWGETLTEGGVSE